MAKQPYQLSPNDKVLSIKPSSSIADPLIFVQSDQDGQIQEIDFKDIGDFVNYPKLKAFCKSRDWSIYSMLSKYTRYKRLKDEEKEMDCEMLLSYNSEVFHHYHKKFEKFRCIGFSGTPISNILCEIVDEAKDINQIVKEKKITLVMFTFLYFIIYLY